MPLKTYIRLAGTNGFLPGPIDLPGRENAYLLLEGAHAVRMLSRRSNGFTGTRHFRFHEPFFASFPLDKAYPSLMECLCHGGTLPVVEISLWDLVEGSVEEEPKEKRVFLFTLENVRLTQVRTRMREARLDRIRGGKLMQARVGMVYDKVTWLHDEGYILFWDSLKDTGKEEAKPEEDWDEAEPAAAPEKKAVEVLLQNPLWDVAEVGFNEEATLSVDCELPEEHKSRKRVEFVLFAKTPKGPEQIAKADGFTENGRATCKMPVYKPRYRGEDGEALKEVEYFFTAKHTLSEPVDSGAKPEGVKSVDKMADPLIDTHVVAGVTFGFDSSFLHPDQIPKLKELCEKIAAWRKNYPDGKMALFGHTDAVGKETYNKGLSERRARSVYAFLMGDPSVWEELHKEESWSFACTQALVKQAGYDPGAIDGADGPKTQGAVKDFQEAQGLKADGIAGPQTREALFIEFMRAVPKAQKLALTPKHFDKVDGQPHMGCSEFNRVEVTEDKSEANRRVTVVLVKSSQTFPVEYPCKRGNIGPCQGQVKKAGERRTKGFGCAFYDGLVVEKKGNNVKPPINRKVKFVGITDEQVKQYVNLPSGKIGNGIERFLEVEIEGAADGQPVFWTVSGNENNSKRTDPKTGIRASEPEALKPFKIEPPLNAPRVEMSTKVKNKKSSIILSCGVAGGDSFIVEAGVSKEKMDVKVTVVNWRKLEYEIIQPLSKGEHRLTDYTVFNADKTPGLSVKSKDYLKKVLGNCFVEFDQAHADVFGKKDIPLNGEHNIFDGKYLRKNPGKKIVVLSFDQTEEILRNKGKHQKNHRTASMVWCDYLADFIEWDELFSGIVEPADLLTERVIFERAIDNALGYPHGSYSISQIQWGATKWQDVSSGIPIWKEISSPSDPGWEFKKGGILSNEAEIKDHIQFKDFRTVAIRFPDSKPNYPGKIIEKNIGGQFTDKGAIIGLTIRIRGIACEMDTNGAALNGDIWMNTFAGEAHDVGMAAVIAHELAHNMGQAYADKSIDSVFGRPTAKQIPGVPFPKGVPEGDMYGGKGHQGTHCANGVKNKSAKSFHTTVAALERTCIMFGASGMDDPSEYSFCTDCTSYIKAENISDIRKSWSSL